MNWKKKYMFDWENVSLNARNRFDEHAKRMNALLTGPIYITDRDPEPGDLVQIVANEVVNGGKDDYFPMSVGDSYIGCFATVLANNLLYRDGDDHKQGCLLDISPLVGRTYELGIGFTYDELRIINVEESMAYLQGQVVFRAAGADWAVAAPPAEKISCGNLFYDAVDGREGLLRCTPEHQCTYCRGES